MTEIKVIFDDLDRQRMMIFDKLQTEMNLFERSHTNCRIEIKDNVLMFIGEKINATCHNKFCFNYDQDYNYNCNLINNYDTLIQDCHAYKIFKDDFPHLAND